MDEKTGARLGWGELSIKTQDAGFVCHRCGIGRPTLRKWFRRYEADGIVRSVHAEREGEIFSWDDPPPGGHRGEDYGCRCTAEPYVPALTENLTITLRNISYSGRPWTSDGFVEHYFSGRGRGVTVRQTGHLSTIVESYMIIAEDRIKNTIAVIARQNFNGSFSDHVERSYDMTGITFSVGDTPIGGRFRGLSHENLGILSISGEIGFYLRDEFADPLDIGEVQRRLNRDDGQGVEGSIQAIPIH